MRKPGSTGGRKTVAKQPWNISTKARSNHSLSLEIEKNYRVDVTMSQLKEKQILPLLDGERAPEGAPVAKLAEDLNCIPQHYLVYQHTRKSVEQLVMKIHYHDRYPIFVSEDEGGIYIQIGVIGWDNYLPREQQSGSKIVYGRKWRVEPQLPSSEIIQTVFLAIKKAREHEIRELFQVQIHQCQATPFNNHHDLPMMAHCRSLVQKARTSSTLEDDLSLIQYDGARFSISHQEQRHTGQWLVELSIIPGDQTELPEICNMARENKFITLLLEDLDSNELLHRLMRCLLDISDRHVDEHFQFEGFARFSWQHQVMTIAELSVATRQLHHQPGAFEFKKLWRQTIMKPI